MSILKKFQRQEPKKSDVWARPEMWVTFRAEIMPGKSREERTFKVKEVFVNGRVSLHGFKGEYRESEFEKISR